MSAMIAPSVAGVGRPLLRPFTSRRPFTSLPPSRRAPRAPVARADLSQVTPGTIDAVQDSAAAIASASLSEQDFGPAAVAAGIAAGEAVLMLQLSASSGPARSTCWTSDAHCPSAHVLSEMTAASLPELLAKAITIFAKTRPVGGRDLLLSIVVSHLLYWLQAPPWQLLPGALEKDPWARNQLRAPSKK